MKYGPEITKEICEYIAGGMGRVDACALAHIDYETFTVWMEKPEFTEAIKQAEVLFKQYHVNNIMRHTRRAWPASAWFLERKFPLEFGNKAILSNPDGTAVNLHVLAIQVNQFLKGADVKNLTPNTAIDTSATTQTA